MPSHHPAGGNFTLAELGVCDTTPTPHPAAVPYCPDLALLQRGYSLSAGSDADSDPEGPLSPERAIQLWAGQGRVRSRRSSGVSSHENSALTLTDSENDNKSDDESGRTVENVPEIVSVYDKIGASLILGEKLESDSMREQEQTEDKPD